MGIEPTLAAWEAAVLPLNYTRANSHSSRGPAPVKVRGGRGVKWITSERGYPMQILLNGTPTEFPETLNARELIQRLELTGKRIALEVNGEIVPRSSHAEYRFKSGDKVEIVHAIGGG